MSYKENLKSESINMEKEKKKEIRKYNVLNSLKSINYILTHTKSMPPLICL